MKNYTINQLLIFREILKEGSMNKAAQHFDMNQSAVSRAIQTLEKGLGFQLFYRQKKQLFLTQEGQRFATELDKFLGAVNIFDESITAIYEGIKALRIGVPTGLSMRFAPEIIQQYQQRDPRSTIHLDIRSSQALCADVDEGRLDMALVAQITALSPAVTTMPVIQAPLVCVVNKDHALAKQSIVHIEDIVKAQVIFPSKLDIAGVWVNQIDLALFKQAKIVANVGAIVGLVEQNLGIAVLNVITATDMANNDKVCIIPLEPTLPLTIHLICRLDWMQNHDVGALISSLKSAFDSRKKRLPAPLAQGFCFDEPLH